MNQKISQFLIDKNTSVKETMRVIDENGAGVAFLVDKDKRVFGVVTDGDIRRAILEGINIRKPIEEIANKKPLVIQGQANEQKIQEIRNQKGIPLGGSLKVPLIDKKGQVKDIVFLYVDDKHSFYSSKVEPKFTQQGVQKVLLIGGAGYLGSVLCRKMFDNGYKIRVFDNLTYGDWGIRDLIKNKNFEFLKGDIRNISDVVEAIRGVDAVIHLAAIVGDPACSQNPKETLEINYLATKMITEICKYSQINRFIFSSTCSVYGQSPLPDKQLTEESALNPVSLYAETKIKCEQSILEAGDENFSPTILRMATLYGYSPNMRFDLVVNFLSAKALFEKKISIFGGDQWRPWLHLEDAAQSFISCLEAPIEQIRGEIFNVLSENHRIIEVAKIINSVCPKAELEINKKMSDKRDYNVSFAKLCQTLNYQPRKRIADGVLEIKNFIDRGLIEDYKNIKYRIASA